MSALKWFLVVAAVGGVVLFIWRGWGNSGDLSGLFLGVWNFFYFIWDAAANTFATIWNSLIGAK